MKTIVSVLFLLLICLGFASCGDTAVEPKNIQATSSLTITAGDQTFTADAANIKATYYPTGWSNDANGNPTDEENLILINATAQTGEQIEVVLFDIDQHIAALKGGQSSTDVEINFYIQKSDQGLFTTAGGENGTRLKVSQLDVLGQGKTTSALKGLFAGPVYKYNSNTMVTVSGNLDCFDLQLITN